MNSIKLYADNVCVAEVIRAYDDGLISANTVRELIADAQPTLTIDAYSKTLPANEIRAGILKRETNCPNCGAPINGKRCEYCGTWFVDPTEIKNIDIQAPKHLNEDTLAELVMNNTREKLRRAQIEASQACQSNSITSAFINSDSIIAAPISPQAISATNIYPYREPDLALVPVMTKETWIKRFKNYIRRNF